MGKQEEKPVEVVEAQPAQTVSLEGFTKLQAQLAAVQGQLDAEQAKKQAYTIGKQPLDEMVGAPKREPVVSKLPNGTKRVDF